jgi:hypothetical protein
MLLAHEHSQQIEMRIDWVQPGEDWRLLCETAPMEVRGVHFDKPSHCFERDHHMWAMWEVDDTLYC